MLYHDVTKKQEFIDLDLGCQLIWRHMTQFALDMHKLAEEQFNCIPDWAVGNGVLHQQKSL